MDSVLVQPPRPLVLAQVVNAIHGRLAGTDEVNRLAPPRRAAHVRVPRGAEDVGGAQRDDARGGGEG